MSPAPRRRGGGRHERQREPVTLSDVLGRLATDRGWHDRLRDGQVHQRWVEIAGEDLAAHTEPVRLHGGVLVVRVASGAWAEQLRYLTPRLLERARQVLGAERVRRVQVVTGETAHGPRDGEHDR